MSYRTGHPVRLIGGRLALDATNTADWSADGRVVHEKIETLDDLRLWGLEIGLGDAALPAEVERFRVLRRLVRGLLLGQGSIGDLPATTGDFGAGGFGTGRQAPAPATRRLPLETLIAISALSVLGDPRELGRIKMCPGTDCGWLFIDESRNGRRRWCSMETCGNRAKAARHYRRHREAAG